MEPKGAIRYSRYTDAATGKHGVRILVANQGDAIIEDIKVEFVYDRETPVAGEWPSEGGEPRESQDAGGRLGFGLAADEAERPLRKGEQRKFLLSPEAMPLLKTLVQTLPAKQYRIAVTMNGKEKGAIPGKVFGEFVEREFPEYETVDLSANFGDSSAIHLPPPPPSPEEGPRYHTHFAPYVDPEGHKGVSVCITNRGTTPMDSFEFAFVSRGEPQPSTVDQPSSGPAQVSERLEFALSPGQPPLPIRPGETRTFLLPPRVTPRLRSLVESLSAERYYLESSVNSVSQPAIPGRDFGNFMKEVFPLPDATLIDSFNSERIEFLMRLAGHIAELSWDFKIYPPKEVTDDPSVLQSDQVLAKLSDTKWWLQFADGTEEMLSFTELLVLTYQLIQLRTKFDELRRKGPPGGDVQIAFGVSIYEILQPECAKNLLSKVTLEGVKPSGNRG